MVGASYSFGVTVIFEDSQRVPSKSISAIFMGNFSWVPILKILYIIIVPFFIVFTIRFFSKWDFKIRGWQVPVVLQNLGLWLMLSGLMPIFAISVTTKCEQYFETLFGLSPGFYIPFLLSVIAWLYMVAMIILGLEKKYRSIVLVLSVALVIIFVTYTAVHEYGHLLIATMDGAEVTDFQPWPVITRSGIQNPHTDAPPDSFSSKNVYILFKSGGFLITFIPSFLLWALLYYKKIKYWGIAFISMFLSLRGAKTDLLQIGWLVQGLILATTLWLIIPFITWVLLGVWYLRKAMKNYATSHPRIFIIIQLVLLVIIYF